jgi:hypothetical protein
LAIILPFDAMQFSHGRRRNVTNTITTDLPSRPKHWIMCWTGGFCPPLAHSFSYTSMYPRFPVRLNTVPLMQR